MSNSMRTLLPASSEPSIWNIKSVTYCIFIFVISLIILAVCEAVFTKEAVANSYECYYDNLYGSVCDREDAEAAIKKHRMMEYARQQQQNRQHPIGTYY